MSPLMQNPHTGAVKDVNDEYAEKLRQRGFEETEPEYAERGPGAGGVVADYEFYGSPAGNPGGQDAGNSSTFEGAGVELGTPDAPDSAAEAVGNDRVTGKLDPDPAAAIPAEGVREADAENQREAGFQRLGPDDGDSDEQPAKSASKQDWVNYAVSQGEDREDAESKTKDELIDEHGE